jgi:hypothetical protein
VGYGCVNKGGMVKREGLGVIREEEGRIMTELKCSSRKRGGL